MWLTQYFFWKCLLNKRKPFGDQMKMANVVLLVLKAKEKVLLMVLQFPFFHSLSQTVMDFLICCLILPSLWHVQMPCSMLPDHYKCRPPAHVLPTSCWVAPPDCTCWTLMKLAKSSREMVVKLWVMVNLCVKK